VNEIAEKESRAKQYYRPIYTMHKWWARRPGCLFRAITLYSLLDENTNTDDVAVHEPAENQQPGNTELDENDVVEAIANVDTNDPLWDFYQKDLRIEGKKVLDPFMGGGTSIVEASRFGVDTVGMDLNPVAWFVTKKELEASQVDVEELEHAYTTVKEEVADAILDYYRTPCPNDDHEADVMYSFWVKELDCVSCGHAVPLFKDYRVAAGRYENDDRYNVYCPECESVTLVDDWQDESDCTECGSTLVPEEGNVSRGRYYDCPECGQRKAITAAIADQGEPRMRQYAIEYYCPECDQKGREKSSVKGYKAAETADEKLFEDAKREWETRTDLHSYVPDQKVPDGATTIVTSEVNYDGHDLSQHAIDEWTDMFNERQLLCLARVLQSIEKSTTQELGEYLLLAVSEALRYNNLMVSYNTTYNKIGDFFRTNSFDPPTYPIENNVWGTKWGSGTFSAMFDMVLSGVEFASSPTDRYVDSDGKTEETPPFGKSIGCNSSVYQGDMRTIDAEDEYDAVITDPPYYDNVIYSELSDYFYVWQKVLLEDQYDCYGPDKTPRAESLVTNPYLGKTAEEFEHEMGQALAVINRALKEDGTLAFTYHHSDSESWGELLESLCTTGFEVTATYPANSDLNKFTNGEAVMLDIVIVARPTDDRDPISWDSLRRRIVRTARETREVLEQNRELTGGDIGVIEMGKCFQEYSRHHGKVHRAGEILSAKDVVDEIYGVIQDTARSE
jgi:adenine-specific DNA methylase